MVAPVLGGAVLTLGGTWRTLFRVLVAFGLAHDGHRHRGSPRVAATRATTRRRTAPVRQRPHKGDQDPGFRRLHADRRPFGVHDDGLHCEVLLALAGSLARDVTGLNISASSAASTGPRSSPMIELADDGRDLTRLENRQAGNVAARRGSVTVLACALAVLVVASSAVGLIASGGSSRQAVSTAGGASRPVGGRPVRR
jgi:hypothetical protein